MKIIADTNVLLRAILCDDEQQSQIAQQLLRSAELVILGRYAFCEMVWVMRKRYKLPKAEIARVVRTLLAAENVLCDPIAIEFGLATMESGADFADGVIAHEGRWLGGETFVSFDKKAVAALEQQGVASQLLG